MTALYDVLRRVEVAYGIDGWHGDEKVAPHLYSLHERPNGRLRHMPMVKTHAWLWDLATTPAALIDGYASIFTEQPEQVRVLASLIEGPMVGICLAAESWSVSAHVDDAVGTASMRELGEGRMLHRHPKRETLRVVYGMTFAGEHLTLVRHEREPHELREIDSTGHGGAIPDALDHLAAALAKALDG